MKLELTVKKEFDVKYLQAKCGVMYWEDAEVNGEIDEDGKIPCRDMDLWSPLIELETGQILNWVDGVKANVHYKVCDCGVYELLDENKEVVKRVDGYVIDMMSPKDNGYGDYVIMDINENVFINDWEPTFIEFEEDL